MSNPDAQQPGPFDPDPTAMRYGAYGSIDLEDFDVNELATVSAVKMLLLERKANIAELVEYRRLIERERGRFEQARQEVEELRVRIAADKNEVSSTWLEIPASVIAGAGASLLIVSASQPLAWVMLVLGILMILGIRQYSIARLLVRSRQSAKERKDD